jgi:hypothetical protein
MPKCFFVGEVGEVRFMAFGGLRPVIPRLGFWIVPVGMLSIPVLSDAEVLSQSVLSEVGEL